MNNHGSMQDSCCVIWNKDKIPHLKHLNTCMKIVGILIKSLFSDAPHFINTV